MLRSRSPDTVRQEIYGYLLTHYATCVLIAAANCHHARDPQRTFMLLQTAPDPCYDPES